MVMKLDPAEVERLAGEGLAGYQIAQAMGISYDTLARRIADTADIADALKRGAQAAIGRVENALFESAIKGNLGAQVFYLKNRASDRWKDRTEQALTVAGDARTMTDDELAAIAAASGAGTTRKAKRTSLAH